MRSLRVLERHWLWNVNMEIVCRNVICLIFNIFTLSVIRLEVSEDQRQFWENKKVPGELYFHSWDPFFPPKEWFCGLVENKWYSVCSKIGYSYLQLASYFEGVSVVFCPFQQRESQVAETLTEWERWNPEADVSQAIWTKKCVSSEYCLCSKNK